MSLMVSISGVRGIVGESLTPEVIVKYASAFGEYSRKHSSNRPHVVLGRDGRSGGNIIANIVSSTLLATGVDVRAIGVATTPTVQIAVERTGASGGISVTASHNPAEWNGLKFLGPSGTFLDAEENRDFWKIADTSGTRYAPWSDIGSHMADDSWDAKHVELALTAKHVNTDLIKSRGFRIVVDCVNCSGGRIIPGMLRDLGCSVVEVNCDESGVFPHKPEPVPENLTDLCSAVRNEKADLGIAIDPDGDRIVLITETGEPFGEEYTIASAVRFVLQHETAAGGDGSSIARVVTNLSTTRAVEDVAAQFGAEVIRTPVGEINVVKKMIETKAVIGGEGSGGVIYPAVHFGRDAVVALPLILQLLAEHGGSLSEMRSGLPQYSIVKDKVSLPDGSADDILRRISDDADPEARVTNEDGLRLDYPDYWVHLRKSNTEPILRIIAESRTQEEAESIVSQFRNRISPAQEQPL